MTTTKARVQAGVSWLDETIPDWRGHVDINTLEMGIPNSCVLGQLFRDEAHLECLVDGFDYAVQKYFADIDDEVVDLGFDIEPGETGVYFTMKSRYGELNRLWKEQL